jgi:hypothetical protein
MEAMQDPVLIREAEVPRPRTQGAALVAMTFLALFAALGTAAFALRVRSLAHSRCNVLPVAALAAPDALPDDAAPVVAGAGGIVPVELITHSEVRSLTERHLTSLEREHVDGFRQLAGVDAEAALEVYLALPRGGAARRVLAPEHHALAEDWMATQLPRLARELERHDCGAVNERLTRMQRLLPERALPRAMDGCPRERDPRAP